MEKLIVAAGLVGALWLLVVVSYGAFIFVIRHNKSLSALVERLYQSLPMSQDNWD